MKPCILNIKPKTNGYRCSCFKLTSHCGTRCRFEERLLVKNQRYSIIDWVSLLQVNVFLVHCLSSIKSFCRRQKRIQRNWNVTFKLTLEPVEREYVFHWRLSWQVFWLIVIVIKEAMISYITSRNLLLLTEQYYSVFCPKSLFKVRAKRRKMISTFS